jgi:predicted RNase H-like HicB family nuclease
MDRNISVLISWSVLDDCYIAVAGVESAVRAFGDTREEAMEELETALSLMEQSLHDSGEALEPLHAEGTSRRFRSVLESVE